MSICYLRPCGTRRCTRALGVSAPSRWSLPPGAAAPPVTLTKCRRSLSQDQDGIYTPSHGPSSDVTATIIEGERDVLVLYSHVPRWAWALREELKASRPKPIATWSTRTTTSISHCIRSLARSGIIVTISHCIYLAGSHRTRGRASFRWRYSQHDQDADAPRNATPQERATLQAQRDVRASSEGTNAVKPTPPT